jgi:hypothetical protein
MEERNSFQCLLLHVSASNVDRQLSKFSSYKETAVFAIIIIIIIIHVELLSAYRPVCVFV